MAENRHQYTDDHEKHIATKIVHDHSADHGGRNGDKVQ